MNISTRNTSPLQRPDIQLGKESEEGEPVKANRSEHYGDVVMVALL